MESLAVKYRPTKFEDVVDQPVLIRVLQRQIETKNIKNSYIFCGASGCGKTTVARIFANNLNKGFGEPVECDAASHNSVDDVRLICDEASTRAVDCEYKVFIIDEAHMITTAGWNAFLKTIEEPPKYTIFIFCTTDPQKIPKTISNRCQVFQIKHISNDNIVNRLKFICSSEGIKVNSEVLDYIATMSNGSMRQAITYLDKCKDLTTTLTLDIVVAIIGDCTYRTYFKLTNLLIDGDLNFTNLIDDVYNNGTDLKVFINNYLTFVLQLAKYCCLKNFDCIKIPNEYSNDVVNVTSIDNNIKYFTKLVEKIMSIKMAIKNDIDIKSTFEAMLIGFLAGD